MENDALSKSRTMSSGNASELAKLSVLLPSESKVDPRTEAGLLDCREACI